jgi:sulfur carrier protein ThiS
MTINFIIQKKIITVNKNQISLMNALLELDMHPESYLAVRNGQLITADTILDDGDEIKLIAAISGG